MKWRKLGPYSLICLKTLNYGRPSPLSVTKFSEGPRCLLGNTTVILIVIRTLEVELVLKDGMKSIWMCSSGV